MNILHKILRMGTATMAIAGFHRLGSIESCDGKRNEVIYHPPKQNPPSRFVVFFGGDMQDYKEKMLEHRDNKRYADWDLESTAVCLHGHFPGDAIIVVKPSKMSLMTFSCYQNFTTVNNFGAPTYQNSADSLRHLKLLLQNIATAIISNNVSQHEDDTEGGFTQKNVVLVGFSKGCVVLNQLLYSIHYLNENPDPELNLFLNCINEMYWLEGGHSGEASTWVTDKAVLLSFSKLGIIVHIHVTPYQVMCATRPRIGKEEKRFRENLCQMNVDVRRSIHFESEPGSLKFHFQVLEVFKGCV